MKLEQLSPESRLLLLKFLCAFAWADLEIKDKEQSFLERVARHFDLRVSEIDQFAGWLKVPPRADELDPEQVPRAERELFLSMVVQLIDADGDVSEEERENLLLLEEILLP